MRILTVLAHPNRDSFTGACVDAFHAGLEQAGHEWELADLHAEGFNPCFQPEDFAQFSDNSENMPEDVLREQARLKRVDAIAIVFPVYWWSFPAILKGWFDRVWSQGWAYDFGIERSHGRLQLDKAVLLIPGGTSNDVYRRYGYHETMKRTIDVGLMGYCGIQDVAMHIFPGVDDKPDARGQYLELCQKIGRDFAKTDDVVTLVSRSQPDRN